MALSKQNALIVIMFLVPVICCFVGIGAFVHVILAAEEVEQQKQAELRRQTLERLEKLQRQLTVLQEAAKTLLQKIAEVEEKIRVLSEKLLQASKDRESAEDVQREISRQKELLAKLLAELSGIRDQIAEKQKQIDALKNEIKEAGRLDERLKELQQRLDDLKKQVDQARSEHRHLDTRRDDLRRQREEAKNEARILPPSDGRTPKPVYVECNALGVVVQPQGTQLSVNPDAEDRSRFLAAARRTGYVVFLIRPNGFDSFNSYRALIQKEPAIEFGLEPVDASWNLIYPK